MSRATALADVSGRLEELSIDLDCEELQGLANDLQAYTEMSPDPEKACPRCGDGEKTRYMVLNLISSLVREGVLDERELERVVYRRMRDPYQTYASAVSSQTITFDPSMLTGTNV